MRLFRKVLERGGMCMKRVRKLFIQTLLVLSLATGLTPNISMLPNYQTVVTVQAATYSKTTIKAVQKKLNKLGYDCGTADGVAGSKTKSAIKKYQKAEGLSVTGSVNKELLKSLGIKGTTVSSNQNSQSTSTSNKQSSTVYITKTGSKYHRDGCRYLSRSKIAISLSDAKKRYTPCSVCNP